MAEAKRIDGYQPPLPPPVEDKIVLELTQAEANALLVVGYNVGGSTVASPRKHIDEIIRALESAGVNAYGTPEREAFRRAITVNKTLYFGTYE